MKELPMRFVLPREVLLISPEYTLKERNISIVYTLGLGFLAVGCFTHSADRIEIRRLTILVRILNLQLCECVDARNPFPHFPLYFSVTNSYVDPSQLMLKLQLSFQLWTSQMQETLNLKKHGDTAFRAKDFFTAINCYTQVRGF